MTPGLAGIDHIVVLMLENRSFDHMLGYLYRNTDNVSPSGAPLSKAFPARKAVQAPMASL